MSAPCLTPLAPGIWHLPLFPFVLRLHVWLALFLMSFLASPCSHINSGGGLEPIKIYNPQVVSEIPRINLLSGLLICVMSEALLQQMWQDGDRQIHSLLCFPANALIGPIGLEVACSSTSSEQCERAALAAGAPCLSYSGPSPAPLLPSRAHYPFPSLAEMCPFRPACPVLCAPFLHTPQGQGKRKSGNGPIPQAPKT